MEVKGFPDGRVLQLRLDEQEDPRITPRFVELAPNVCLLLDNPYKRSPFWSIRDFHSDSLQK